MVQSKRNFFPRPRVRKIPLNLVRKFLNSKGYAVDSLDQQWRHVTGVVRKNNRKFFLKMATTIKTGKMTEVEFFWNELVSKRLPSNVPFKVPDNIEKGLFDDKLFFFISEYFGSETLADKYPPLVKRLADWTPVIAKSAYVISSLRQWSESESEGQPAGENLLESATEWASQLKSDTKSLLKVIKKSAGEIKEAFNHGDFVPWHMYNLGDNKLGLIDAEHGGWKPKYYDVAYFYLRVRQNLGEKELARKFLLEFIDLLIEKEKITFWNELKPVLAQRLVGNFWEVEKNHDVGQGIALKRCENFKEDLLKERIV